MSTDLIKDKQVHQNRTLAEIKASVGTATATGIHFSSETEISDETLEAVAGGGVANLDTEHSLVDQS